MSDPIIVSLTTTPDRMPYLNIVIESLLSQTTKPDKIVLNIPYISRNNKKYSMPTITDNRIFINRCEDLGPITKLLPTLNLDIYPNSIIVTVDDDTYLHPNTLSIIKRKSRQYPTSVFSFSGICVGNLPFYWGLENDNTTDKQVDIVEGVHSICYRRWMLDYKEILHFKESLKNTIGEIVNNNDDHVISAYLSHKNINKISLGKSAKDYFYDLEHKKIGGISTRKLAFWWENIIIANYLKKIKLYTVNADYKTTIGFNLFIIPLFLLFCKNKLSLLGWGIYIYLILNNIKLQAYKNSSTY